MDLKNVNDFLLAHNFVQPEVSSIARDLLFDMWAGLDKNNNQSDQAMIIVPRHITDRIPAESSAIIIDAGGTNFRSCLVTADADGKINIDELQKTSMPAIKNQLSKDEFYNAIADNIEYLKNKAERIGFCFSYAMELNDEGDGKVLAFSKEINAPEVVGTYVGKELMAVLKKRGWNSIEKISLVNDTMACLLAGTVQTDSKKYDSFIGFILGTGINNAYVEPKLGSKIVVCECGMYGKLFQSDFDKIVDEISVNAGCSKLEKMCSGAYLGKISLLMLKAAAEADLFSAETTMKIKSMSELPMNVVAEMLENCDQNEDFELLRFLLANVIDRAARIVAGVLVASVISSGRGFDAEKPVCIVCNGTTFWKTPALAEKVREYLCDVLEGEWKRYFEIVKIENDITKGTFAAAF